MNIDTEIVEDVREMLSDGKFEEISNLSWSRTTLSGSLHLACLEQDIQYLNEATHTVAPLFDRWSSELPMLRDARRALRSRGVWPLPLSMSPETLDWEIIPVPLEHQVSELIWSQFQMRFQNALKRNGFKGRLPHALTGALHEMADNALRHSGPSIKSPAAGAVGYSVGEGEMTFSVVDIGQGILNSLRTNPNIAALTNDMTALRAAVLGRATSDAQKQIGDGFEQVHRALADFNGHLRFRSGDAALQLKGRRDDREITPRHGMPSIAGFHLAVRCRLDTFESQSHGIL